MVFNLSVQPWCVVIKPTISKTKIIQCLNTANDKTYFKFNLENNHVFTFHKGPFVVYLFNKYPRYTSEHLTFTSKRF